MGGLDYLERRRKESELVPVARNGRPALLRKRRHWQRQLLQLKEKVRLDE